MEGVGTNRYAYAENDPVNKSDPSGHAYDSESEPTGLEGITVDNGVDPDDRAGRGFNSDGGGITQSSQSSVGVPTALQPVVVPTWNWNDLAQEEEARLKKTLTQICVACGLINPNPTEVQKPEWNDIPTTINVKRKYQTVESQSERTL